MENVNMPTPEVVAKMAWSYLLIVSEKMGGARDALQQLPVSPDMVPGFSWVFLLGVAVRELFLMGATTEQVRQMFENALQQGQQFASSQGMKPG